METMSCDRDLDLAGLYAHVNIRLPVYARPLFMRIRHEMEVTVTFKQKKVDLRNDGFDPARIGDDLFFNNAETGRFEPLDVDLYRRIQAGGLRL